MVSGIDLRGAAGLRTIFSLLQWWYQDYDVSVSGIYSLQRYLSSEVHIISINLSSRVSVQREGK